MAYYDPKTWQTVDPSKVYTFNNDAGGQDYYTGNDISRLQGADYSSAYDMLRSENSPYTKIASGDPTKDFMSKFGNLGATTNYLQGLVSQGYGAKDFNDALNAYGQTSDQGWWGDQATLRALGTGFDKLGKNTGWQSQYNAALEPGQQKAAGEETMKSQYHPNDDLGMIMSGLGLVLGAGALGGAFGGSGLFGGSNFPVGGADWMSEIAAGAGNGGATLGSYVPAAADATWGVNPRGGGMDWLDQLISSTQNDPMWSVTGNGDPLSVLNGASGGTSIPNIGPDFGELPAEIGQVGAGSAANTAGLPSWLNSMPTSPIKSALSSIFSGGSGSGTKANAGSLASLLGTGLGGILDYMGTSKQADNLKAIADRSWAAGQPYRDRANAAMTPGFDVKSIPGLSSAMDTATETYLRKLSATNGNPAGIGAAPSQTEAFVLGNVALPAWQNYFNANSNAGGLSNLSAQANSTATQAAGADAASYGSLGTTANKLLNPNQDQTSQYLNLLSKAYGLA